MDRQTSDLLYGIPEHADYAADAGELDEEDIPKARMDAVTALMRHAQDAEARFLAARLMASWGVPEGLKALERCIGGPDRVEGVFSHRLHGYDDTYRHVVMAVTLYWARQADRGEGEVARGQVYPILSAIIDRANSQPFSIAEVLDFMTRNRHLEYAPLIKRHLESIIDHPHVHGWKIPDAIKALMEVDADFVHALLETRGKSPGDY